MGTTFGIGESFVFYSSFLEAIEELPEEIQLKAFKAITKYGLHGYIDEDEDPYIKSLVTIAAKNINNAKSRYEMSKKNGQKGAEISSKVGRPRKVDYDKIIMSIMSGNSINYVTKQYGISARQIRRIIESDKRTKYLNVNINI